MAIAPKSLLIERRYRRGKRGTITSTTSRLLLPSQWLEAAGFTAGDEVQVHVAAGQLILRTATVDN